MNTKALYYTNLAYLCADVATVEAEAQLKKAGYSFKREEKQKLSEMKRAVERLRFLTKDVSSALYEIENAEDGCNLSDFLYEKIQELLKMKMLKDSGEETVIEIQTEDF
ncbi:MAG: hypothetical protein LBN27_05175 [Prevotellaceae bacterium]|jgi:hypothetical protein|nr:hypothetical protein [Prevotellaceae bacterium]